MAADGKTRKVVQYPRKPGTSWAVRGPGWKPFAYDFDEEIRGRVVGAESIEVPAGTFDCMKVVVDIVMARGVNTNSTVLTRWYCPQIKSFAKEIRETTARYGINERWSERTNFTYWPTRQGRNKPISAGPRTLPARRRAALLQLSAALFKAVNRRTTAWLKVRASTARPQERR